MSVDGFKQQAREQVAARADELVAVSRHLWEHPELGFAEHEAHDVLTGALARAGLEVTRHAHGLDTAFRADVGHEGPTVAVLLEYDALPGLGHACGHNIIAAAGLGAGLAAAAVAELAGGRVRILGTPAEEGGGGKVFMLRDGAFDGVDAAMMIHPADRDLTTMRAIAIQELNVVYRGEAAHAAAAPHEGRNALDAAVLGYVGVAALRQHIRPDERIHGIFTEGGEKPNIVPRRAAAQWYVRAGNLPRLEELKGRVHRCLHAGADAAGCEMTSEWRDPAYADMVDSEPIVGAYAANAAAIGRPMRTGEVVGSTDMGNVSHTVPSIHPMIAVAPEGVPIHTEAFAEAAGSAAGDRAVVDGAMAMAMTVIDLWCDAGLLDAARAEFAARR